MTRRVRVDLGSRGYDVVVGEGVAAEVASLLAGRRRVAVVTQGEVARLHGARARDALSGAGITHELFLVGDGEQHKTLTTVEELCRAFASWGLRRADAVVALGGGLVGDIAGFTASVYYRGVDVVQVPTTLLAMVDAAIGGKTGVNLPEGKNLVGAFHQPLGVLADPATLATLSEREYRCGLGEVVKYALLGDDDLTALFVSARDGLLAREPEVMADVVARCAAAKARVVEADEEERSGLRARLNYGHTLAHGLETVGGYDLAHGEAVAVGLVFAAALAAALGRVEAGEAARTRELVASLGLPVEAPPGLVASDLLTVMARDKKASGAMAFVLPGRRGYELVADPDPAALRTAFTAVGIAS